jgi:hypothetical protein
MDIYKNGNMHYRRLINAYQNLMINIGGIIM